MSFFGGETGLFYKFASSFSFSSFSFSSFPLFPYAAFLPIAYNGITKP